MHASFQDEPDMYTIIGGAGAKQFVEWAPANSQQARSMAFKLESKQFSQARLVS